MGIRHIALIVFLGIGVGLVFGGLGAVLWSKQASAAPSDAVELGAAEQNDFIIMTAEAYASDGDRNLAQDRLGRLHEPDVAVHVANLAARYAPQRDLLASNLALLAVALGSKDASLIALSISATPPPTLTATPNPTETPTATATFVPSATSTLNPTFTPTQPPTLTPTATRRPPTRVPPSPTPTMTATPTTVPPPPTEFDPWNMSDWPPGITFWPANVTAGTTYWHLTKAIYCDFTETNYQCPSLPGGSNGTSIYVMTDGEPIDVIKPDGTNVGKKVSVIGDKKSKTDVCECTWAFLTSDYKISVASGPSDALSGFSLYTVHGNVLQGHAHVRFFLYFKQVTR